MEKTIQSLIFFLISVVLLASCGQKRGYTSTPAPEALLDQPQYRSQIASLDRVREEQGEELFEDLIREGRVSKEPNGTKPIVIRVFPEIPEEGAEESLDKFPVPSRGGEQVEEYFISEEVDSAAVETQAVVDTFAVETADSVEKATQPTEGVREQVEQVEESAAAVQTTSDEEADFVAQEEDAEEEDKPQESLAPVTSLRPRKRPDHLISAKENTALTTSLRPLARPDHFDEIVAEQRSSTESNGYMARWDGRSYADRYTSYVLEGLERYGDHMLEKNLDDDGYCPRFNSLNRSEKKQVWLMLISSMIKEESGYNTSVKYRESNGHFSRGLFQLGYESTHAYSCGFTYEHELHDDPEKNIHCGIKILDHWMKRDGVFRKRVRVDGRNRWRGGARYWAVLRLERARAGDEARRWQQIKDSVRNLRVCR